MYKRTQKRGVRQGIHFIEQHIVLLRYARTKAKETFGNIL